MIARRLFVFGWLLIAASSANAQTKPLSERYTKAEYQITMRDGKKLHTTVYAPMDRSKKYPIVLKRTPYSCAPYGKNNFSRRIGPSRIMENDGYIFVHQDVRGRWMSEGSYDNMRPHVAGATPIDESSDTYDSIEWLLKNIPNNNGKVGMWGISYPGFYSAAALPEHHPNLVAVSPQAPIADFYFDDFHHQGAYILMYFFATPTFGYQKSMPTTRRWYSTPAYPGRDPYDYFLKMGPLSNAKKFYGKDNFFWQQIIEHPNYDEFWKKRSILPHLKNVKANVMTVGGWFDAEDLYGPLNIYRELEKNNPDMFNVLVMGPWQHGAWSRGAGTSMAGNLVFGENLSLNYQKQIEAPFFRHFLKGTGEKPKFEAMVFDCGSKQWKTFTKWPPRESKKTKLYPHAEGKLSMNPPAGDGKMTFVSDPAAPVPYRKRSDMTFRFTPRPYMSEDQRFATGRKDVLVFQTDVLKEDVTLAGPLTAHLKVSTDKTAADWIVKLIDVYPDDTPNHPKTPRGVKLAGYQQMVRSEVLRGRFRNGHDKPEAFVPNRVTTVSVPLQDVLHTFKKGHRIMIHVQSSWFPLIDRNPQTYVENIFEAKESDFVKANHTLYLGADNDTHIEVNVIDDE